MVAILDKRARKVLQHHDDVLMHQKFFPKVEIALLGDVFYTLLYVLLSKQSLNSNIKTSSICNAPPDSELNTDGDSKVFYCSKQHKELHWPSEQESPYPFIVKYRPDVGRYM